MKKLFTAAVFVSLIITACGSSPVPGEPGAVITIGERSILASNLDAAFEPLRGDTVSVDVLRDNIISRELFIAHAMELGLQNDREAQRLIHERRREILQAAWLAYELGKVQSDSMAVMAFWESLGTGITYTSLSLRDSLLMDSVLVQVRAGEHLSRFATELGLEDITRTTGGKISIPDKNYANLMDLDYLRDAEVGDIIGPFDVAVGCRLLQIDSTWTYEPAPFSVDSQHIASLLLARAREDRKKIVEDSLLTALNVEINPEALALLTAHNAEGGFSYTTFTPEEDAVVAVTWDGGSRDVYSVYRNVQSLPGYLPRRTDNEDWTSDYLELLSLYDIEMQLAIEQGLDTLPENARKLENKEFEVLLDSYYEVMIGPFAQPDSSSIADIFLEIREDYPVQETRVFDVLFLAGSEKLNAAEAIMASGDDMMDAADQFETFPPILEQEEEYRTVPLARAMIPENDRDTLFGLNPGEETLVSLNDTTALWFRLIEINPEHLPEFADIRDRVVSMASQRRETEVIQQLSDSLRSVYDPYIDEEYFKEFYIPAPMDSLVTTDEPVGGE